MTYLSRIIIITCFFQLVFHFRVIAQEKKRMLMAPLTYEYCGCELEIGFEIYNGLTDGKGKEGPYGGDLAGENGAITIVNKNDTDGDGVPDNIDDEVAAESMPPFSGRHEVDLMKILIRTKNTEIVNESDECWKNHKLRFESVGSIKFWDSYLKSVQAPLEYTLKELNLDKPNSSKELWVEALEPSTSIGDIVIQAKIDDILIGEVKATAIWMESTKSFFTPSPVRPENIGVPLGDLRQTITNNIDENGSYYGMGFSPQQDYYGGKIVHKFCDIQPSFSRLTSSFPNIDFDVARRQLVEIEKNGDTFKTLGGQILQGQKNPSASYPKSSLPDSEKETSNDGPGIKSHVEFDGQNSAWSYDGPRQLLPLQNLSAVNFFNSYWKEWVRVSFKESVGEPGNTLWGSRCSNDIDWLSNRALVLRRKDTFNGDPFDPDNHENIPVVPLNQFVSAPTRVSGMGDGNGNISININHSLLQSQNLNPLSKNNYGYFLKFDASGAAILMDNSISSNPVEIDRSMPTVQLFGNGSFTRNWTLKHTNALVIDISDNSLNHNTFDEMDIIQFSFFQRDINNVFHNRIFKVGNNVCD